MQYQMQKSIKQMYATGGRDFAMNWVKGLLQFVARRVYY